MMVGGVSFFAIGRDVEQIAASGKNLKFPKFQVLARIVWCGQEMQGKQPRDLVVMFSRRLNEDESVTKFP